jgi:uncharacterized protein YneF (UPF0154 family)
MSNGKGVGLLWKILGAVAGLFAGYFIGLKNFG